MDIALLSYQKTKLLFSKGFFLHGLALLSYQKAKLLLSKGFLTRIVTKMHGQILQNVWEHENKLI